MWCAAKCCVLYHTAGEIVTFSTTSVTSVCTGDTFSSRRRLGHCCAGWFFDTLKGAATPLLSHCIKWINIVGALIERPIIPEFNLIKVLKSFVISRENQTIFFNWWANDRWSPALELMGPSM